MAVSYPKYPFTRATDLQLQLVPLKAKITDALQAADRYTFFTDVGLFDFCDVSLAPHSNNTQTSDQAS